MRTAKVLAVCGVAAGLAGAGQAREVESPEAARALDCAVYLILSGAPTEAVSDSLARAARLEGGETGAFSERLMPRLQAAFATRLAAASETDPAEIADRRREACPAPT